MKFSQDAVSSFEQSILCVHFLQTTHVQYLNGVCFCCIGVCRQSSFHS